MKDNKIFSILQRVGRSFMLPTTPVQFADNQSPDSKPAPLLGENTVEIVKELGYSDEEAEKMIADGVIKQYGK